MCLSFSVLMSSLVVAPSIIDWDSLVAYLEALPLRPLPRRPAPRMTYEDWWALTGRHRYGQVVLTLCDMCKDRDQIIQVEEWVAINYPRTWKLVTMIREHPHRFIEGEEDWKWTSMIIQDLRIHCTMYFRAHSGASQ